MRLTPFESAGQEPLGEGEDRKVFVDPEDETRVISERRDSFEIEGEKGPEKDTIYQLKGRFYLTKIAHLLLPKNIPDVYQAGESPDGKQTIDAERISHTEGHAMLQKARLFDMSEKAAARKMQKEMGQEIQDVTMSLSDLGFGFNIDENISNFTKDEEGNVHYLETFKPWDIHAENPKKRGVEVLFGEEELRAAIDAIPDEEEKAKCIGYLERLNALLDEERQEQKKLQEEYLAGLPDCTSEIARFEENMEPLLKEEVLSHLHAITTEAEAGADLKRAVAKAALNLGLADLKKMLNETNISDEEYLRLYEKFQTLSRAVGMINSGKVDHTR